MSNPLYRASDEKPAVVTCDAKSRTLRRVHGLYEMLNGTKVNDLRTAEESDVKDVVEAKLQELLKNGKNTVVDPNSAEVEFPPYFDQEKFHLGQQIFYNNIFTMMVAKLCGLITILSVPTIIDVLIFTKLSGTPCMAFRRYVATIFHTVIWYEKKPSAQSEFFLSLKNVRKKHCIAFRRSAEAGLEKASQLDMALAQFGFVGFTLISHEKLGVRATREELDGLIHFWRVIGYMLGMEEKYNLCTGTIEETQDLCRRLLDHVFLPRLAEKDENFEKMTRVLLEGLWPMIPFLDTKAFTAFTLQLAISGATNNNHSVVVDTSTMTFVSRFLFHLLLFVYQYLMPTVHWWSVIFRSFFNGNMRLAIFLTEHFPFLAYWVYGIKRSHVNIYKHYLQ